MYEIDVFKVAVVGEAFAGKTSIVQTLLSGGIHFSKNYVMTSDVTVSVKDIAIPEFKDVVELILLDSAGNFLYEDYLTKFWKELDAAFVVFDLTSEDSFSSIEKWINKVKTVRKTWRGSADNSMTGVIFANKNDAAENSIAYSDKGRLFASQIGFGYFEGSAKNNSAIEESFRYLAKELYNKYHSILEDAQ